jgi:hypothetical protein
MMADAWHGLAKLAALDTPVLPDLISLQLWRNLAWGVVLISLLGWTGRSWNPRLRWGAVGVLALWCGLPGPIAPPYWLGLAFQSPSISAVVLCVLHWQSSWSKPGSGLPPEGQAAWTQPVGKVYRVPLVLACLGVALGWLLLADTLAWTPVAVYACGFSPLTVAGLLLVLLAPWAWSGQNRTLSLLLALGLIAGFVVLRLPTGNAWDAVLDPGLWVFLHGYLAHQFWTCRTEIFKRIQKND